MENTFKKNHSLEDRIKESSKIIKKYEDRIPIIVTKESKSTLNDIKKNKYLAPKELTLGQFVYVIRKRIDIDESQSLFVFINNSVLAPTSNTMANLYESYKDEDGFLYLTYCGENVFGNK